MSLRFAKTLLGRSGKVKLQSGLQKCIVCLAVHPSFILFIFVASNDFALQNRDEKDSTNPAENLDVDTIAFLSHAMIPA